MNDFRADLHCHTTCSDGSTSPTELIKQAVEKKLKGLSITDHDTISAYQIAWPIAQQYHLRLISGVEFSTTHKGQSVHVLAYSFALNSPLIEQFCQQHKRQRQQRNQAILDLLTAQGMPIQEEDLIDPLHSHTIGRPHIAQAMVKKGYVSSIPEAFHKYIGEGCSCYAAGHYFQVEETIDLIHQAQGFAVIAHPHLIDDSSILLDLLNMHFDGIEGYYGRFQPADQERWVKIGKRRGWLITGGSDFHGDMKPHISLGSSWVNEETFQILEDRFKHNQATI